MKILMIKMKVNMMKMITLMIKMRWRMRMRLMRSISMRMRRKPVITMKEMTDFDGLLAVVALLLHRAAKRCMHGDAPMQA
jgi:hypothetical protein